MRSADPTTIPPPNESEVLALLESSHALLRGHFLLSSGLHSSAYVQCARLLESPARARRVGELLAHRLRACAPESILAPALGGVIVGHEVAAALAVPFRFVERQGEGLVLRRGFALGAGERVVIVEDVVTTGKSTRETAAVAEALGAHVVAAAAILDRSGGQPPLAERPFLALAALALPTFRPEECPLCREGGRAEKPGSRPQPSASR